MELMLNGKIVSSFVLMLLLSLSTFLFQVCPICAANLGKDALSHFTVQHAHSIKVCRFPCDASNMRCEQ